MGKKTDYIECGLVRPEAVAEGVPGVWEFR